jgi:hypothetical protein
MLVIAGLAAEDIFDILPLSHGRAHHVVKHGVVAGMAFDEAAHGGDFVGIKNGAKVGFIVIENRRQGRGDAHVLVGEDDAWLTGGADAQGMQGGDGRRSEADILLVIPDVFEAGRFDAKLLPQLKLELADSLLVESGDVNQKHFRRADDAGALLDVLAAAVDDADAKILLDLAELGGEGRAIEMIEGAIEHLALRAEALLAGGIGGPERTNEDVALNGIEIDRAGEEAVEHSADAADLLDGFVGNVNDGGHAALPG